MIVWTRFASTVDMDPLLVQIWLWEDYLSPIKSEDCVVLGDGDSSCKDK